VLFRSVAVDDVAFQVHDIDGDGVCEVIYARDFELVIADGRTGRVRKKVPTPIAKPPADRFERILGDCLFFCDMRGTGRAADIVIKDRYWHFWVYDDELRPLWDGACRTGHYPYAFDIDGDGRDELAMGYSLFDDDGSLLWTLDGALNDHADGIAILDFAEAPGSKPKILYAASDEGLLFADTDGTILQHHRIGHAQNPVIARRRNPLYNHSNYQASVSFPVLDAGGDA
jgi:rhamnogalacturonan endolyase